MTTRHQNTPTTTSTTLLFYSERKGLSNNISSNSSSSSSPTGITNTNSGKTVTAANNNPNNNKLDAFPMRKEALESVPKHEGRAVCTIIARNGEDDEEEEDQQECYDDDYDKDGIQKEKKSKDEEEEAESHPTCTSILWSKNGSSSLESQQQQQQQQQQYSLHRSQSAERDILSVSTALMGEIIIDSPLQSPNHFQRPMLRPDLPWAPNLQGSIQKNNNNNYTQHLNNNNNNTEHDNGNANNRSSIQINNNNNNSSNANPSSTADALSVGIMAQGLAWARRQRDRRQRLYLQHQAEQQLHKIRQAQAQDKVAMQGRSLIDNPTFQNLMHLASSMPTTTASSSSSTTSTTILGQTMNRTDALTSIDCGSGDGRDAFFVSKSGDGYSVALPVEEDREEEDAAWIPTVRIEEEVDMEQCPLILDVHEMQEIAGNVLPRGIAYCRWKRLYSLARDGDSFDACLRNVANEKQSLLVVRTSRNSIFGGFADAPWEGHLQGGASYYGGPAACLFRIDPNPKHDRESSTTMSATNETFDKMNRQLQQQQCDENACTTNSTQHQPLSMKAPKTIVKHYPWTGANRYIQLCDARNKMLAFGGGGDDGSFGLCLEQDFQLGSTGSCATFDNDPLCDQENFEIVDMEIYGFLVGQF